MNRTYILMLCLFLGWNVYGQEICNNGIDDDANGLVDLNDPGCDCTMSTGNPVSLIPNPSFEDWNCCPFSFSELSCADNWFQASWATSDYFNTCGFIATPVATSSLFPFPDGQAAAAAIILADYKEYIGACLTTSMTAGTSYTLQMNIGIIGIDPSGSTYCDVSSLGSIDWTLFGTTSCVNLPFSGMDCPPATDFVNLGSVSVPMDGQYHLIDITFTPTQNISGIAMGSGCNLPAGFPINMDPCMPYAVVDNLVINESSSFGSLIDETGSLCGNNLVLTADVTTPGGTYQWYHEGVAIVGQTGQSFQLSAQGYADGDYQVVYSIAGDCAEGSITIDPAVVPVVDVNDGAICQGGNVVLTATGATTYTWTPSTGLSATTGASVTATPSTTTTYTVTGNTGGCTASATATVTVTNDVIVTVADQTACPGEPVTLTASGANTYVWSPAQGLSATTGSTVTAQVGSSTTYTIVGTVGGCIGTTTADVNIISLDMDGSASPAQVMIDDPTTTLTAEPAGNDYTWYFEDGTQYSGEQVTYTFEQEPGMHTVTLVGENAAGCIDSVHVRIEVKAPPLFYVPNSFTPDGDEHNNIFQPVFTYGFDPHNFDFFIFNRWGEIIFESHDASKGWDGTYHGKLVPQGTYSWTITFKAPDGDDRTEVKGHVTIIR